MRWLLPLLVLMGCADETRCTEAPLAGNEGICTRIEGTWLLQAMDSRVRCGAKLFTNPVNIISEGSDLSGNVDGSRFSGVNYASGSFTLSSHEGRFSLNGDYRMVDGQPELVGGVAFGGFGQTCDALWDFTARRE